MGPTTSTTSEFPTALSSPSPSPSPSSSTSTTSPSSQFWAVCPKSGECDEEDTISESSEWHTVRCCSDEEKPGWKKNDGCNVWGQSLIDKTCSIHESHSLALGICLSAGARLCTKEELAAECTADSGCGADNRLAWSSSSAAQGPTASPTSGTTGVNTPSPTTSTTSEFPTALSSPSPSPSPSSSTSTTSPSSQFWAVCPKSGECDEEDTIS